MDVSQTHGRLAGIDYGAKTAGTTVIAYLDLENKEVQVVQSQKNKSADDWLIANLKSKPADLIAFDAPLSLPGYYQKLEGFTDYFYRVGDRELKAMSPLFLGGLTARAIRIRDLLHAEGIKVVETYPGKMAERLEIKPLGYKKQKEHLGAVLEVLEKEFLEFSIPLGEFTNWHRVDALIALWSAWRIFRGENDFIGDQTEGGIYL
ncbi:MAG: hypothetical protein AAF740_10220 [Bacteroidota bacterium]